MLVVGIPYSLLDAHDKTGVLPACRFGTLPESAVHEWARPIREYRQRLTGRAREAEQLECDVSGTGAPGVNWDSNAREVRGMARAVSEIYDDIQALSYSEKNELLRTLVAELDAPADPEVEKAWLEEAQRRCQALVEGKVQGVSGDLVFERLRTRLGR